MYKYYEITELVDTVHLTKLHKFIAPVPNQPTRDMPKDMKVKIAVLATLPLDGALLGVGQRHETYHDAYYTCL